MTEADVRRVQEWLDKTQTGHQWLFLDEKLKTVKCHKCDEDKWTSENYQRY